MIGEIDNWDLMMELMSGERQSSYSSKNPEYPAALQAGRAFLFGWKVDDKREWNGRRRARYPDRSAELFSRRNSLES